MGMFERRFERLELKYLIDESTARAVSLDLQPYCVPDVHSARGGGYRVDSLYLDTPSLAFHEAKERGDAERLKLRIRRYGGDSPPILELKRRSCDVIEKTRVAIEPGPLDAAAQGYAKLRDETPQAVAFLERFARLVLATGAGPALLVRYDREAYTSDVDHYARVTFDRDIAVRRTSRWSFDGVPHAWAELDGYLVPGAPRPPVVMEIKCEKRIPLWATDLVRRHRLQCRSFSKYSMGIFMTARLYGSMHIGGSARGVLL